MLFPESERVLYKKNPLVEVICQLRFPTILRIREGHLADFQDMIRKDYPGYSEQEPSFVLPPQMPKEFAAIIEQMKTPPGLASYRFSTKDLQRFISLSDGFMSLAETKYERWESFKREIAKAENALKRVYEPALYSRVGLRYRDIISRRSLGLTEVGWQGLLKPYIIAELGDKDISDAILRIQTRVIIKIPDIPNGQVVINHGLITPNGSDEECYLIDADFSVDRKEGIDEPFEILDEFNRMAGRLFRWAITERLHKAMEPRAIRPRHRER
jgi:uncharacterized protein (TIGR04255 family)